MSTEMADIKKEKMLAPKLRFKGLMLNGKRKHFLIFLKMFLTA